MEQFPVGEGCSGNERAKSATRATTGGLCGQRRAQPRPCCCSDPCLPFPGSALPSCGGGGAAETPWKDVGLGRPVPWSPQHFILWASSQTAAEIFNEGDKNPDVLFSSDLSDLVFTWCQGPWSYSRLVYLGAEFPYKMCISFILSGTGKQVFLLFQLPFGFCALNEAAVEEKPTEQMEINKIFSLHLRKKLQLIHSFSTACRDFRGGSKEEEDSPAASPHPCQLLSSHP
ncbi:uncharacterized protein LOC114012898 isoform X2 [Falco peregrinus]|uniref:uncharacterized protein LOC114012898 isoform X2 n=1 Tax=Falco peregrinus TaxID=8954 RepID=UPI000FFC051C|nr:uncharacterized protein LOC114012898 isoform X2 [Falco peregrinus]